MVSHYYFYDFLTILIRFEKNDTVNIYVLPYIFLRYNNIFISQYDNISNRI